MRMTLFTAIVHHVRKILHTEVRRGMYGLRVVPVTGGYRLAAQHNGEGFVRLLCIGNQKPFARQKDAVAFGLERFKRLAKPLTPSERAALNGEKLRRKAA